MRSDKIHKRPSALPKISIVKKKNQKTSVKEIQENTHTEKVPYTQRWGNPIIRKPAVLKVIQRVHIISMTLYTEPAKEVKIFLD